MSRRSSSIGGSPGLDDSLSMEKLSGLEAAAVAVLKRAVEMDNSRRYLEALTCYREGLGLLMEIIRNTKDDTRKQKFRSRVEDYMNRAEKLKILIEREKQAGRFHEQYRIADGAVGYSYESLLKPLLDEEVTHVDIEDPYIRSPHQLINLLRLCEVFVRHAPNLKSVALTTGQDDAPDTQKQQQSAFENLTESLRLRSVTFIVHYSVTLHDREIRFNNGWVVQIGRGLDYFKPVQRYAIGFCDYDLRPCHETTVDIFHRSGIKKEPTRRVQFK